MWMNTSERPLLYSLASELIWPEAISRARSHPSEVTWRDGNGGTALHHSCRFEYAQDVVREMVKSHIAVTSMQDNSGSTPLHVACWNGSSSIIQILVDAHRDAALIPDKLGRTPLHLACSSCPTPPVDTIAILLKANPGALMAKDAQGHTPLSLLCQRHELRLRMAMESIDGGFDIDYVYSCILNPFWTQLRLLLEAKVGKGFASQQEWRLVHALTGIPDCPPVLFDLGLKLHPEQVHEKVGGSLPLHLAASCPATIMDAHHKDGYYVCSLLSLFPKASQVTDRIGRLPVHIAIECGKSWDGVIQKLLQVFPTALLIRDGKYCLLPAMLAALPTASNDMLNMDESACFQLTSILELLTADPSQIQMRR